MSRRSRSPARPAPAPTLRVECDGVVWSEVESGRLVPDTAKQKRSKSLATELKSIFLPVGYPDSVRPEYLRFQAFDTLQAACSYLRSILTTSAILRAAGVGEDQASPMAAAVAWVLRDGVGARPPKKRLTTNRKDDDNETADHSDDVEDATDGEYVEDAD